MHTVILLIIVLVLPGTSLAVFTVVLLLMVLTILSFGTVAWAQATFPNWASHPAAQGLRVHLSNGFYLNAVFDRLTGGWAARSR